ncbi:hypothetical protein DICSQDRAFT_155257 [Dichomitus squalens LYAD-421 SS1]|uniref:Uncharacterized protein n=1 Tax=Dichomitus squalens (strain LYAD-421) TaxID=732165 RepID=R7SZ26_DICSQ|nr:uncharacterized protein DICSQDRAFT_155257 [Dichomitus squalens LYAD-421 SS1]EJF61163.1 hypothetical protein DICSQDRAFT_155257 [Dichomitus squalens LYAD-421 SS1]
MPGGQQWLLPQSQAPMVAPPTVPSASQTRSQEQAPPRQPSAETARTAGKQRDSSQDEDSMPLGSDPDDEEMLVSTLWKAKARGISPRKALEKLHLVYNHTALEWKDYCLENLERLLPKIYPPEHHSRKGVATSTVSHSRLPSSAVRPEHSSSKASTPSTPLPRTSNSNANNHGTAKGMPARAAPVANVQKATAHPSQGKSQSSQPLARTSASATQSKPPLRYRRGSPAQVDHAGLLIPPSSGLLAPVAPRAKADEKSSKFTDEDKIFFIHFLRWRLRQPGAIPSKKDLYKDLAKQTAHHDAEAWKKHWYEHPECPDREYIKARKRAEQSQLRASSPSSGPGYARIGGSSDEDDETSQESDGEDAADNASVVSYCNPNEEVAAEPVGTVPNTRHTSRGRPVTLEEIRAMAQFKAERRDVWEQYTSKQEPWKEFAERPENKHRTLNAWYCVTRDRGAMLDRYYRQYLAEAESSKNQTTPPQQDTDEGSTSPKVEVGSRSPERSAKRGYQTEPLLSSPRKRIKHDDERRVSELLDSLD